MLRYGSVTGHPKPTRKLAGILQEVFRNVQGNIESGMRVPNAHLNIKSDRQQETILAPAEPGKMPNPSKFTSLYALFLYFIQFSLLRVNY